MLTLEFDDEKGRLRGADSSCSGRRVDRACSEQRLGTLLSPWTFDASQMPAFTHLNNGCDCQSCPHRKKDAPQLPKRTKGFAPGAAAHASQAVRTADSIAFPLLPLPSVSPEQRQERQCAFPDAARWGRRGFCGIPGISDRARSRASGADPLSRGLAGEFGQLRKFRYWVSNAGRAGGPAGSVRPGSRTDRHSACRARWNSDERCIERRRLRAGSREYNCSSCRCQAWARRRRDCSCDRAQAGQE